MGHRSLAASQMNSNSDSDDGMHSLYSDETEINIPYEDIEMLETKIKSTFKKRLDVKTLERPGICHIFPREEYKFDRTQEYTDEQERQHKLWELARKLFKLQRQVQDDKKLTQDYEDKYIKFNYLSQDQLHKYSPMDEEEYLRKKQRYIAKCKKENKPITLSYNVLSKEGEGMTYKMWKTNARLIRSILDTHGFDQIGTFD
jgi:hypothetical protein